MSNIFALRYPVACVLLCLLFGSRLSAQEPPIRLNYLNPETYSIDSLSVEGAYSISPSVLFSVSGLQIGDKIQIPGNRIAAAIKNIWKQGLLSHIDIKASLLAPGSVHLHFVIQERPRLTGFTFSGINRTQRQEIGETLPLSRGRIITDLALTQTQNNIEAYFKKKGYLNAEVRLLEQPDATIPNGVRLRVVIRKGRKVRVRSFRILGQRTFSQPKLKNQFTGLGDRLRFTLHLQLLAELADIFVYPLRSWQVLSSRPLPKDLKRLARDYLHQHAYLNLVKGRKFDEKKYKEGKQKLIAFLQSKGHRSAYIGHDTLHQKNENEMDVQLLLYVGQRYYIRDIRWTGNFVYDSATLTQVLGIKKGNVYDPALLERQLAYNPQGADVSSLYLDNGYLFFNAQPAEVRVVGDSVDIEIRIFEGKQANIERVLINGNSRTREHVFRRELRTLPGEQFSRADIIRTQQQLSQLPFIDVQATKPVPKPNPETQKVDIEWQITEKAGDQVELSAGWGAQAGVVGSLGFVLNNFSARDLLYPKRWRPLPIGDGQRLAIRLRSNGRAFTSLSTSFTEPWLGGRRRNNLTVSYTYSRENYFRGLSVIGSFALHGVNAGLVRSLRWPDDYFTLGYLSSYNGYRLRNASSRSLGFTTGNANSLSFSLILGRSSIDNPNYPSRGSYFSLASELTPPYSWFRSTSLSDASNQEKYKWVEYNKWLFDAKTYTEILPKLVLESRMHFGLIGRYSSRGVDTPFERFTLGGDGQGGQNFILGTDIIGLRGYPNNSILPIDRQNNIEGGRYFIKNVFELRYLFLQLAQGTIYGLSFLESGNSWNEFADFSFYDLYRSLGFGVRLNIPAIGLIGLDWGRGFDLLPNRRTLTKQFHFTIGRSVR